ncbi:orotidine 5'-phosphate decarboxylase [Candidatus Uhrbacteria bacterium RIFCSPHIGHO2_01_FULL_46_23]|nr:MAG: Orotidine 5'-phosphate decarboxylase [Parcubacteria group bacterium GW2011_GWA2_46_9]OGL60861.1 MAG: orotidine 5'-phosphate decarboxylase [Candidatus Uhrbacteria bacterium RIFCSPHIGHO2_01_FULL_46_23]
MSRCFREMVQSRRQGGRLVCVGLDPDIGKIGKAVGTFPWTQLQLGKFFTALIDATAEIAAAFKPNRAFFGGLGIDGSVALQHIIAYIKAVAPEVPIIIDPKYADIGKTNDHYVREAFEVFGADAVTVHPYLGCEAMKPFLAQENKGIIVLCRTSNPGAGEFQDLEIPLAGALLGEVERHFGREISTASLKLYEYVAYRVCTAWNINRNCGLVVGATYPEELKRVREIVRELLILIPGIGTQGGDLEASVRNSFGGDALVNSSSGILYASTTPNDFAEVAGREAEKLDLAITDILTRITAENVGQVQHLKVEGGGQ